MHYAANINRGLIFFGVYREDGSAAQLRHCYRVQIRNAALREVGTPRRMMDLYMQYIQLARDPSPLANDADIKRQRHIPRADVPSVRRRAGLDYCELSKFTKRFSITVPATTT